MFSKFKTWLGRKFPDRRVLICDAYGSARIYSWEVRDGIEVDFRYNSVIIAANFNDFIEYIDAQTIATNIKNKHART